MNHIEQRIWLIEQLKSEDKDYMNYEIPAGENGQKDFVRALMNVRMPKPISQEFMDIQDEYLREENLKAGTTNIDALSPVSLDNRIYLWQGDITTLRVDAIVNAANSQMCGCFQPLHNCIDNIIHSKSGLALRNKCYKIMQEQGHEEPTGMAKITPAYNLPCKYVIHTVGPIVQGPLTNEHEELLASCYRSCLQIAEDNGINSIAFCCISTGVFMFPNNRAAEIAVKTVQAWLDNSDTQMRVIFNVFKDTDYSIYNSLLN